MLGVGNRLASLVVTLLGCDVELSPKNTTSWAWSETLTFEGGCDMLLILFRIENLMISPLNQEQVKTAIKRQLIPFLLFLLLFNSNSDQDGTGEETTRAC